MIFPCVKGFSSVLTWISRRYFPWAFPVIPAGSVHFRGRFSSLLQNVQLFEKLVLKVMFNAQKTLVFDIFRIASRNWYFGGLLRVQMRTERLLYSGFEWGEQFVGGGNG